MVGMPDDVAVLARRARRVLRMHGETSEETDLNQDYTVTDWMDGNLRVSLDSRGDELEIQFFNAAEMERLHTNGVLHLNYAIQVYLESYGEVIRVDESLVETANQILGRVMVLDELADS